MKRFAWLTVVLALILALGSIGAVRAEIIRPYGEGQIGLISVVLCEELTLRKKPDTGAKTVMKLEYGDRVIVDRQEDGWAHCFTSDEEDSPEGWVNADYIAVDPAWYVTEGRTPVYAWDDAHAPKVALLNGDTTLPILAQEGNWLLVSLRGAVGWVRAD